MTLCPSACYTDSLEDERQNKASWGCKTKHARLLHRRSFMGPLILDTVRPRMIGSVWVLFSISRQTVDKLHLGYRYAALLREVKALCDTKSSATPRSSVTRCVVTPHLAVPNVRHRSVILSSG